MKGMIFCADSIKAFLDGRKTMTRRVIKPQPNTDCPIWLDGNSLMTGKGQYFCVAKCRYKVGEVIYAKETFCYAKLYGYDARKDGGKFWYKATDSGECEGPYKSPFFMPEEAARIKLEIANIRAERLQEITPQDAKAEGIEYALECCAGCIAKDVYGPLWNRLNPKYLWESNPWVWVYMFKRVEV